MTTYSQKWTLATFLRPIAQGAEFHMKDWPTHVTIVDVFASEMDALGLTELINRALVSTMIFSTTTTHLRKLGVGETVDVILLDKNKQLVSLHKSLIDLLDTSGVVFNNPEFTRLGFLPHITLHDEASPKQGEQIEIMSVSLVDMFPGGDWQQRRVVKTFLLSR